ncbi:Probable two-component sensor histidine kinase [plant metagenome]|uniref:Probable two-component sensor histidine kinase n=1 Tax=plant metagenome TaxID=1297885 RepID=A0A484XXP5_9ZZZZ
MRTWLLALLVLAAEMILLAWDPAVPAETVPGVRTLTQAEFVLSDAPVPPLTGWEAVALPDSWRASRPEARGVAWYRIRFTLDALPDAPKALYLPRVAVAGEVWLNGALLNARLPDDGPGSRQLRFNDKPLYFELPSRMFAVGQNEILVRMLGDPGVRSGLSAPRLGPAPIVARMMLPQRLLSSAMPYLLGVLMLWPWCWPAPMPIAAGSTSTSRSPWRSPPSRSSWTCCLICPSRAASWRCCGWRPWRQA